jgi:hypothetical protein
LAWLPGPAIVDAHVARQRGIALQVLYDGLDNALISIHRGDVGSHSGELEQVFEPTIVRGTAMRASQSQQGSTLQKRPPFSEDFELLLQGNDFRDSARVPDRLSGWQRGTEPHVEAFKEAAEVNLMWLDNQTHFFSLRLAPDTNVASVRCGRNIQKPQPPLIFTQYRKWALV